MAKFIWRVYSTGIDNDFYAERVANGHSEDYEKYLTAHCLACAKSEIMAETGELVDIRGWHKQGTCGSFLKVMQISIKEEIDNDERV
jgi:hypothetical protein